MRLTNARLENDDEGFTLVEMIVAMSIFSVLLVVFGSAMTDWTKDVVRTTQVSDQTSTARNVFNLFDKQVPSAASINHPALVGTDWYFEMQSDAPTPTSICTQWVLRTATHKLQWRTWPMSAVALPAWRTVDTIAQQSKDPITNANIDPFVLEMPDQNYLTQRLTVNLSDQKGTGPITQNVAKFSVRNSSAVVEADLPNLCITNFPGART